MCGIQQRPFLLHQHSLEAILEKGRPQKFASHSPNLIQKDSTVTGIAYIIILAIETTKMMLIYTDISRWRMEKSNLS